MSTPITIVEVQPAPTNVIELQSPPTIVVESVGGEFIGPQGPPGPEGPPGPGGGGSLTSTVTPAALAASAAIGSSNEGARADHAHARPTLGELGAEAAGTAGATMAVHTGAADPHPQYLTPAEADALYAAAAHGHANATPSTPGFMAAADKSKLDGIAASATNTPLSSSTPAALGVAAAGNATAAARGDHVHALPTPAAIGAAAASHTHDASAIVSGTIDPARLPVLPGSVQIVATTIAGLTAGEQAQIGDGSIVTTTDGRRWVYTGSGSKTDEASYIVLADVTPEWVAIANRPTTLAGYGISDAAPISHTHTASQITDFAASVRAQVEAAIAAGANVTITPAGSGATRTFTIAAAGGGGSALSGTAVLSVPGPAGRLEWAQTFAAVGVLPTSRIVLSLAGEADSAENDPELLDVLSLWGTPATGEITIGATFGAQVSGPVTVNWSAF